MLSMRFLSQLLGACRTRLRFLRKKMMNRIWTMVAKTMVVAGKRMYHGKDNSRTNSNPGFVIHAKIDINTKEITDEATRVFELVRAIINTINLASNYVNLQFRLKKTLMGNQ